MKTVLQEIYCLLVRDYAASPDSGQVVVLEVRPLFNKICDELAKQDARQPSEGREQACIDCGDARCVYQETKDCPKASNPAVDLQKLAEDALEEIHGCFQAAYAEGLVEKMAEQEDTDVGSLHDLVNRRLLPVIEISFNALSALQAARGLE